MTERVSPGRMVLWLLPYLNQVQPCPLPNFTLQDSVCQGSLLRSHNKPKPSNLPLFNALHDVSHVPLVRQREKYTKTYVEA